MYYLIVLSLFIFPLYVFCCCCFSPFQLSGLGHSPLNDRPTNCKLNIMLSSSMDQHTIWVVLLTLCRFHVALRQKIEVI